ncbi:ABC transporter substrate-binding protein [Reyranella sp. CPCC 100927]|uniref:ABC transporter substrate-binding protein n=1 Tax=Reyranella sp. CPCC 100927 TaxID=2599616 RepID=UPI0011B7DD99|nr:ABC transporter substrate-binding protein [Reyranella sp. CPCC 100927]TWS96838.1 ABC transporter substrate-binding protein [Reyranella sp. CPCC 100927]
MVGRFRHSLIRWAFALGAACLGTAASAQTLRVVMHSDIKVLDPVWSGAYIVRNHGYLVYDTLFALDAALQPKPQMVESWVASEDRKIYRFVLREGLLWHDGQPVTAEDCIASIRRWGARDPMGQKLLQFTQEMKALDARTFELVMKVPYGLVVESLAKPSVNTPFMMPRRVAETDPFKQIDDYTGSGPFILKRDEWKPGERIVYIKNPKYKPRAEPASGLAGGKVVKVDRIEWLAMPDSQTMVNALLAGEIDIIEQVPYDLLPLVEKEKDIVLVKSVSPNQYVFRPNWLHPPFNNEKVRQAAMMALNQEDFLKAVNGDPRFYRTCKAMFTCGTPLESVAGMQGKTESNVAAARALLKEGGYDGTPVVLLHASDSPPLAPLSPVAKSLFERAGFKVDMQSSDWQSLVNRLLTKKGPVAEGGWSAFFTYWSQADLLDPLMTPFLQSNCEKARAGWPCDETMEQLREKYALETNPAKKRAIADEVQTRAMTIITHVPLGESFPVAGLRSNLGGWINAPVTVFWNVTKK